MILWAWLVGPKLLKAEKTSRKARNYYNVKIDPKTNTDYICYLGKVGNLKKNTLGLFLASHFINFDI